MNWTLTTMKGDMWFQVLLLETIYWMDSSSIGDRPVTQQIRTDNEQVRSRSFIAVFHLHVSL